jgi:5'-deoxynucleotidase
MNHFFAYISRMKYINRWPLLHSVHAENVQEHSLQVAVIAHSLAVIGNKLFGRCIDENRVAVLALFHDACEVITGDMPAPIKYLNGEISEACSKIERMANQHLCNMLPSKLRPEYRTILFPNSDDGECWRLVKVADIIAAYIKCLEELRAGNNEFLRAAEELRREISEMDLPEVTYFMEVFIPSFSLSVSEMTPMANDCAF